MKVMITGATGYVGAALAAEFLRQGAEAVCPGRDADGSRTRSAVASAARGLGHDSPTPSCPDCP